MLCILGKDDIDKLLFCISILIFKYPSDSPFNVPDKASKFLLLLISYNHIKRNFREREGEREREREREN